MIAQRGTLILRFPCRTPSPAPVPICRRSSSMCLMWRGLFPSSSTQSPLDTDWVQEEQTLKIRSALGHIESKGGLDGFAGTPSEKQALLNTFDKQGLIKWNRTRARSELTRSGRKRLRLISRPKRAMNDRPPRMVYRVRSRGVASAWMITIVAAAFVCGASIGWLAGVSAYSVASRKDERLVKEGSPISASTPDTVQRKDVAAASGGVAPSPGAPAGDGVAAPRPADPAQEPAVPVLAMTEKGGAVAAGREEPKPVRQKRHTTSSVGHHDGGSRRDFGGTGRGERPDLCATGCN